MGNLGARMGFASMRDTNAMEEGIVEMEVMRVIRSASLLVPVVSFVAVTACASTKGSCAMAASIASMAPTNKTAKLVACLRSSRAWTARVSTAGKGAIGNTTALIIRMRETVKLNAQLGSTDAVMVSASTRAANATVPPIAKMVPMNSIVQPLRTAAI